MSWTNKVVWSEGLFLQPQLFQQQERYLENFAHRRALPMSPFFWGFSRYRIDPEALGLGKIVLSLAVGVCADGTPFDIPTHSSPPPPLAIRPEHLDQVIHLAVPIRIPNGEETTFDDREDDGLATLARNGVFDVELRDANSIGQAPRPVQLARLRLRLLPEREMTSAWMGLPLARVRTIHSDGSVELEPTLLPPVNALGACETLVDWTSQIHGTTRLRAQSLADRLCGSDGATGQTAEVSDYLMLQLLNRHEAGLDCLLSSRESGPADLYRQLREMGAELATFARPTTRRPREARRYDHSDPYRSFKPLIDEVRELLNSVLVRSAQRIDLDVKPHGLLTASVDPATLAGFQSLVLAVSSRLPLEQLAAQFSAQAKFGPSERVPELVRMHLPALHLACLPVPPRQIPYAAGTAYFETAQAGALWDELAAHGGIALHIAADIPGLHVELWGVRA